MTLADGMSGRLFIRVSTAAGRADSRGKTEAFSLFQLFCIQFNNLRVLCFISFYHLMKWRPV